MTEAQLEKWAKGEAKKAGVLMYKFRSPNKRGVPDQILFYKGRTLMVEFKSPKGGGRLSPLQEKEITLLRGHGMSVAVVAGNASFSIVLDALIEGVEI